MHPLKKIRGVLEYDEDDNEQGIRRIYLYNSTSSSHIVTEKQEVDLIDSPYWGQMLFLDGILQSTTRDEIIYHNALVHPLMDVIQTKNHILILGGGEGATAREVLRWNVQSVTMVDYDNELVSLMKIQGNKWSQGAFYDRRLKVYYNDAWEFMKRAVENKLQYDAIILDLTDPDIFKDKWLDLLTMVIQCLRITSGGFVMNAGLYMPWNTNKLKIIKNMIESLCLKYSHFKYYIYTIYIPSFNGEWTFIVMANKNHFMMNPAQLHIIPSWIRRGIIELENQHINVSANTDPITDNII